VQASRAHGESRKEQGQLEDALDGPRAAVVFTADTEDRVEDAADGADDRAEQDEEPVLRTARTAIEVRVLALEADPDGVLE
jgi:hypothetical protein